MLRTTGKIWFLALLVCLLLLFAAGLSRFGRRTGSGVMSPFMAVFRSVCGVASGVWNGVFSGEGSDVTGSYEVLLREAEVRIAGVQELVEENRQLRTLMKLPPLPGWKALYAEVIMRDPAVWNWSFRINLGEADGVVPGAPVLFGSHIVGRVSEVFNRSADVATLVNPVCRIGVQVISANGVYPGILRGDGAVSGGGPAAIVDYLPKDAVIEDGAAIVTSGLGTELPAGVPVGIVRGGGRIVDDARMIAPVILGGDPGAVKFAVVMRRDTDGSNMDGEQSEKPE